MLSDRMSEEETISIHAPRTGSDPRNSPPDEGWKRFQSTLPARGATCAVDQPHTGDGISIHAPRTGSDVPSPRHGGAHQDFNPRSPHGERRRTATHKRRRERFQSTLPARGATRTGNRTERMVKISIHAPRTGSDLRTKCLLDAIIFPSTLPEPGATRSI